MSIVSQSKDAKSSQSAEVLDAKDHALFAAMVQEISLNPNITQKELATKLNISQRTLARKYASDSFNHFFKDQNQFVDESCSRLLRLSLLRLEELVQDPDPKIALTAIIRVLEAAKIHNRMELEIKSPFKFL